MNTDQFTIRRKFFRILGAFHIYDSTGKVVGFCKQKVSLKDDLRIYTDEDCAEEMIVISSQNIIDFGATHVVSLPDGMVIGSVRRKGLMSTFARDNWLVFDEAGNQIATVLEEGAGISLARRFVPLVSLFSPQTYQLRRTDSNECLATFRTHPSILVRKLGIRILKNDSLLSEPMILSIGCLLSKNESRTES